MSSDRGAALTPRLIIGLALIVLGTAFLLDEMNLLEFDAIVRWWPLVLVAIGLSMALRPGGDAHRGFGAFLVVAGVWLLLYDFDIIPIDFWDAWPLLLIGLGGWIVWRSLLGGDEVVLAPGSSARPAASPGIAAGPSHGAPGAGVAPSRAGSATSQAAPTTPATGADTLSAFGFLSHVEKRSASQRFQAADATAIMGRCTIDLRDAGVGADGAVIDAFAFWGGIDIIVPTGWVVTNKVMPLLGAVEDRTRSAPGAAGQVLVRGSAIMGGVEISNGEPE